MFFSFIIFHCFMIYFSFFIIYFSYFDHFSSFSLTFSWISYVLQHFRAKNEENVTSTWQNLMIFQETIEK